jgi:hypothetical protein
MTRKFAGLLLAIAGLAPVGCKDFQTARSMRGSERPDAPSYSIEEQERRTRGRYGIAEDDFRVGPKTDITRPDPTGVGR